MTNNTINNSPLKRLVPRFISKNTIRLCKQQLQKNNLTFSSNKIHNFRKKTFTNNNKKKNSTNNNITNNNNNNKKKHNMTPSYLFILPIEIIHNIFIHLDCLSLYQLTLTSSSLRYQLQTYSSILWRNLIVDPTLKSYQYDATFFYQCLCFLITNNQLHLQVISLTIDQCPYLDQILLDIIIHAFPNIRSLSMKNTSHIDCWQLLHLLKATHQKNQLFLDNLHYPIIKNEMISPSYLLKALKKMNHPQLKVSLLNKSILPDTIIPTSSPSSPSSSLPPPSSSSTSSSYDHHHHHHHLQQESNNNPSSSSLKVDHHLHHQQQYQLYPCLQYLTKLDIQGAFPSERSYKSYGHEMYCFGEIKKILLQFGHQGKKKNDNLIYHQQLSEGHYALYQFWLLLRSRMLRWDQQDHHPQRQEDEEEEEEEEENEDERSNHYHHRHHQEEQENNTNSNSNTNNNNNEEEEEDFRPPWLPETLIQFIQITEHDHPASIVKIDLAPCRLCHRNVTTSSSSLIKCQTCQLPTSMVCHQCKCLSCNAVLCIRCYRRHQSLLRQTQRQHLQQNMTINTSSNNNNNNNSNNNNQSSSSSSSSSSFASPSNLTINNSGNNTNPTHRYNNKNKQQMALLSSWKTLRCQQCHLPRRTCGQSSCTNLLDKKTQHWFCTSCQQKRSKSYKTPSRFFKRS